MNKIKSIQGLRAIGFILILLEHCGLFIVAGEWAVSLFILILGFCIFINHYNKDINTAQYVVSKVKKYIYCIFLC